jgi:hypothetical protein
VPWWAWVLVAFGIATVVVALWFRAQIRFAVKVAKALATDKRVPRPLRWAIGVALAMKVVPFPDFGVDEVILVAVGLVLVTFYRPTFRAIVTELRSGDRLPGPR